MSRLPASFGGDCRVEGGGEKGQLTRHHDRGGAEDLPTPSIAARCLLGWSGQTAGWDSSGAQTRGQMDSYLTH